MERRILRWSMVLVAVVALAVGALVLRGRGDGGDEAPVAVRSSGASYRSLAELIRASDVVVDGVVTGVGRGRVFSDRGSAGVGSEVVTLRVVATLAGRAPGRTVAIEEEAVTGDDRPLVVDGLRPTAVGDRGVFFLVRADPSLPYLITVATSGRYLRVGADGLCGATGGGPIAGRVAALGHRRLVAEVRRLGGSG